MTGLTGNYIMANQIILAGNMEYRYRLLPVILGDYLSDRVNKEENPDCKDGRVKLVKYVNGIKIDYTVDCKRAKVLIARQESSY